MTATGRGRVTGRWVALVAAAALVATACGGGGDDGGGGGPGTAMDAESFGDNIVTGHQEHDAEPVTGGTLTVGLESETNSYAPADFSGSQAGFNVVYAIYDPLFALDHEGELRPYLAESVEPNEDFTEWTLTLRPDVTFHDGTPLDAEAVVANFEVLSAPGARTAGDLREVAGIEAVDELTVRYRLDRPNSAFPDILAGPIGWPFSPTAAAEAGDAFGDHPVGTGPFRFVSWQRDGALEVERNPDYWQEGLPYLDGITFRPIPDEETRATSLDSGDIDAAQSVRLSSFAARVRDIAGVTVYLGLGNGAGNAMFNVTEPPVDDVRVRQALAHAVDQQALVEVTAGEAAAITEVRTQLFASDSPYYSEEVAEAWPSYDPDRARELLDEYVNDPERSDGKEPGDPVSIQFDATNVPILLQQAAAYQGFWEEVGVEVTIEPLEQSVHIVGAIEGDYQVKSFRAGTDNDPLTVFQRAFGDPEQYPSNLTNYHTDQVTEVLERLRRTDDLAERQAAVEELNLQLAEDVPYLWTGSDITFIAVNERVQNTAGWVFPDGTPGDGVVPGITFWSQVWVQG